jgi:ferritin-like metal-binding protein YciE
VGRDDGEDRRNVMDNARELFEHELRDIYDAEEKLVRATETMAKKVSDQTLSAALEEHCRVTQGQVKRLEKVFDQIGRAPRREKCAGINGLIEEFSSFASEGPGPEVLDFFALGAATKVEHYEIEAYKSLIALASNLGLDAKPLKENLAEEVDTARKLAGMSDQFARRVPAAAPA